MSTNYYPPAGFHFKVEFLGVKGMDVNNEQRFQDVSGLSFEIETESLKEGGENSFEHKLPKRVKYPNLTLKRGLLTNTALIAWFKSAINTYFNVLVLKDFAPCDIMITLLDEAAAPAAIWNIIQAYPVSWSVSDLKASENALVVETIVMAYQYFERKK